MARRGALCALMALMVGAFGGAQGASCVKYEDTLPDGSLGFCAGIVNYEYFLQAEASQVALEGMAMQRLVQRNPQLLNTLLGLLPNSCTTALKKIACMSMFVPCGTVDPYFMNPCDDCQDGQCPTSNQSCAVEPTKRFGTAGEAWDSDSCEASGFWWAPGNKCLAAIPKYPCKGVCRAASTLSKALEPTAFGRYRFTEAMCPLASGLLYTLLAPLEDHDDVDFANEIRDALKVKNCDKASVAGNAGAAQRCAGEIFTGNVLAMFSVDPLCSAQTTHYGMTFDVFVPGTGTQSVLAARLSDNINAVDPNDQVKSSCGPEGARDSILCNDVRLQQQCTPDEAGAGSVQDPFAIAEENSVCYQTGIVTDPRNRDGEFESVLITQDAGQQEDDVTAAKCLLSGKYNGTYYVPPWPGSAPLAPRYDPRERELPRKEWEECPVDPVKGTRFANLAGPEPLCISAITGKGAYNARDCLNQRIQDSATSFSSMVTSRCRAAFLEMLCSRSMMKVERKELCLLPGGRCETNDLKVAAEEDKISLEFILPRFPSRAICETFTTECADVIKGSPALQEIKCDAPIAITECSNPALQDGIFGCSSSLNGLPQFPEPAQTFLASLDSLPGLEEYSKQAGIDLSSTFKSAVVEPTISAPLHKEGGPSNAEVKALQEALCQCPAPLVRPDNVDAATIDETSCCALPCFGTMYTEDDMDRFGSIQLVLSTIGLVCSLFMVLTWGIFAEKRQQYMTFWFSFCSFNASLATFVVAASTGGKITDALCADNSTPHSLAETGFSMCVWQSLWVLFFATAECAWWFVQAVDLFRKIVLGTSSTEGSRKWYHLVCWSVPVAVIAVALGNQYTGFKPPTPFCFFSPETPSLAEWLMFYLFVGITFVTGLMLMLIVLSVIARHAKAVAKQGSSAGAKFRTKFRMYRTPVLFVTLFVFVWVIIFAFRTFVALNETRYREQAGGWVLCLVENFKAGVANPATDPAADISYLIDAPEGQQGCGLTQPGGIPDISVLLMFIVVMGQSVVVFLIFGLKAENFSLWCRAIGCQEPHPGHDAGYTMNDSFTKQTLGSEIESYTAPSRGAAPPSPAGKFAYLDTSGSLNSSTGGGSYGAPDSPGRSFQRNPFGNQARAGAPSVPPRPPAGGNNRLQMFPYQQQPGSSGSSRGSPYVDSQRFRQGAAGYTSRDSMGYGIDPDDI